MGKRGKSPLRGYWLYMVITCFRTSGGPNMDALPITEIAAFFVSGSVVVLLPLREIEDCFGRNF